MDECCGCRWGFPTYTNDHGIACHDDGDGGFICGPSRQITKEEREFMVAMIRNGNVTTDPDFKDEEKPS